MSEAGAVECRMALDIFIHHSRTKENFIMFTNLQKRAVGGNRAYRIPPLSPATAPQSGRGGVTRNGVERERAARNRSRNASSVFFRDREA
eukprot:scaffold189439_cov31-Tisochrysis_lutea.AAC.1